MIIIVFVLFSMLVFFFIHFADERYSLNYLVTKSTADVQMQQVRDCVMSVEVLGAGATCEYNIRDEIGGRNYSLSIYENSTVLSLQTTMLLTFAQYAAPLNQSYNTISATGTAVYQSGEVGLE